MSTSGKRLKKVGFFGVVLVLLAVVFSLGKSLLSYLRVDDRFVLAESDVDKLMQENQQLEDQLNNEDENYVVERELRNSLGLSREGESVVVLPEELVDKTINERKEEMSLEKELKTYEKWWNLFFDKK